MTAFTDFVNLELPKRTVMLTASNTGYTGDPNLSVLAVLNSAPQGSLFIDNTGPTYSFYYKQQQAVSTSWVLVGTGVGGGGGGGGASLNFTPPKTTNYAAVVGDLVLVDLAGAAGDVTITVPAGAAVDDVFGVKIAGSASGRKAIIDATPATVDGASTLDVTTDNAFASFQFDGSNWWEAP